jgi:hypothetical protein
MPPTVRFNEHALLEGLVRKLLDDLRTAHFMIARGATPEDIERACIECRTTHAQLAAALPLNVDRARALGYLMVDILNERIDAMRDIARESGVELTDTRGRGRGAMPAFGPGGDAEVAASRAAACRCDADRLPGKGGHADSPFDAAAAKG